MYRRRKTGYTCANPTQAGTYSTNSRVDECLKCAMGRFSHVAASSCIDCTPGFRCPGAADRIQCNDGYTSSAAQLEDAGDEAPLKPFGARYLDVEYRGT